MYDPLEPLVLVGAALLVLTLAFGAAKLDDSANGDRSFGSHGLHDPDLGRRGFSLRQ